MELTDGRVLISFALEGDSELILSGRIIGIVEPSYYKIIRFSLNALPPSLRDAASVKTFKKNLKTFLFRKAYADRFCLNKF